MDKNCKNCGRERQAVECGCCYVQCYDGIQITDPSEWIPKVVVEANPMREKLIELLCKAHNAVTDRCIENGSWSKWGMSYAEQIETEADSLIANGVTIPVRCKDCVYYREGELLCVGVSCVGDSHANWYPDDFCSYGERRTDD